MSRHHHDFSAVVGAVGLAAVGMSSALGLAVCSTAAAVAVGTAAVDTVVVDTAAAARTDLGCSRVPVTVVARPVNGILAVGRDIEVEESWGAVGCGR